MRGNELVYEGIEDFFGFSESQFFGHILNEHGARAAKHNLTPIEQMVAPEDQSQLRSVLGLFNVHRNAIENFGTIARPLHDLTGKKEWQWGKREDEAFEKLRQQALENHILSSPDFDKQFYCRSDTSNYGKGWVVYQLRDSSKPDTRDNRNTIKYGSKAWGSSMLGKPPY